ncbi:unnamed protein product [Prorocentrum cordatum]|uniref:Cupin-like domain-containing protein n=1 Tax=Prorocentrum cordatum TaxID=2364126 RepID=A0ABN9W8U0_9DINO|nr:unnamed protein product [Polarella glacialis]
MAAEADVAASRLSRGLRRLAQNTAGLWAPPAVPRRPIGSISPVAFVREHVAASQPVVLTDLPPGEWPCLRRWSDEYLLDQVGDLEVSVNLTPGGLGDFVNEDGLFVKPLDPRLELIRSFPPPCERMVQDPRSSGPDISGALPLAAERLPPRGAAAAAGRRASRRGARRRGLRQRAGGREPVGRRQPRRVLLPHGPLRNLYVVVRGEKVFTLLPPTAAPFLCERRCQPAHFERRRGSDGGGGCTLEAVADAPPAPPVPWVPVDVGHHQIFKPFQSLPTLRQSKSGSAPAKCYICQRCGTIKWHSRESQLPSTTGTTCSSGKPTYPISFCAM